MLGYSPDLVVIHWGNGSQLDLLWLLVERLAAMSLPVIFQVKVWQLIQKMVNACATTCHMQCMAMRGELWAIWIWICKAFQAKPTKPIVQPQSVGKNWHKSMTSRKASSPLWSALDVSQEGCAACSNRSCKPGQKVENWWGVSTIWTYCLYPRRKKNIQNIQHDTHGMLAPFWKYHEQLMIGYDRVGLDNDQA